MCVCLCMRTYVQKTLHSCVCMYAQNILCDSERIYETYKRVTQTQRGKFSQNRVLATDAFFIDCILTTDIALIH